MTLRQISDNIRQAAKDQRSKDLYISHLLKRAQPMTSQKSETGSAYDKALKGLQEVTLLHSSSKPAPADADPSGLRQDGLQLPPLSYPRPPRVDRDSHGFWNIESAPRTGVTLTLRGLIMEGPDRDTVIDLHSGKFDTQRHVWVLTSFQGQGDVQILPYGWRPSFTRSVNEANEARQLAITRNDTIDEACEVLESKFTFTSFTTTLSDGRPVTNDGETKFVTVKEMYRVITHLRNSIQILKTPVAP